jgi:CheY-like chemotaxis protein
VVAKRILVIEDEQIVARDLQNLLRRLGHRAIGQASNGPDAIRMAAETRPDLVLMDVTLEGKRDGLEVSLEIARHRSVPIVFITANAQSFVSGASKWCILFCAWPSLSRQ